MLFLFILVSQVVLLGMDILSALVSRLQERFRTQVGTGGPSLFHFIYSFWEKNIVNKQIYNLFLCVCFSSAKPH